MMRALVWHDKHGDEYFEADCQQHLDNASLEILARRKEYFAPDYDAEHIKLAEKILKSKNGKAAYKLLLARNRYEYEEIELINIWQKGDK